MTEERQLRTACAQLVVACRLGVALAAAISPAGSGAGAAELRGTAARIEGPGWVLAGLDAELTVTDEGIGAELTIAQLDLATPPWSLVATRINCVNLQLAGRYIACRDGVLSVELPALGRLTTAVMFEHDRRDGVTRVTLPDVALAGGQLSLQATTGPDGTLLGFRGAALDVALLAELADDTGHMPAGVSASGRVDVEGEVHSAASGALALTVTTLLHDLSLTNEPGTVVAEALGGRLGVVARSAAGGWSADIELDADRGEVYVEPVYVNLASNPLQLAVKDARTRDFTDVDVGELRLEQQGLLSMSAAGRATRTEAGVVASGRLVVADASVDALYNGVLRILAAGTVLGDLETAGRVSGVLELRDNEPQSASVRLESLTLDDRQRRFAVYGLNGELHWPGPGSLAAQTSVLGWDSASVYGITLDGAELHARLGDDDVALLRPLRISTMGGALLVNQLVINDYGSDAASGLLDAELEPIQLGQLTGAFGWPAFSGSLAGRLPLLQYEGNAMTVGGSLTASAFDGGIVFSNLRIEQPFGRVPRLQGDLRLRQLDLQQVTSTFSFGLIQGRLSGDVTGLRLVNWRPVAMDLHLYTPAGDRSAHRISQRAVENLASVGGGGGAAAALSSGLLKFFEVFAYDRIGLRCVLRDGICAMSGTGEAGDGPPGTGYYIVKGKGVPRIDVVGYRSRVSWNALLRQLSNITRADAPIVN